MEMGIVHTSKDKKISMREVELLQHGLNSHTSMWLKILNVVEYWSQEDRFREARARAKRFHR